MRSLVVHLQQLTRDLPDIAARYNLSRTTPSLALTEGKGAVGDTGGEEERKGERGQEHRDEELLVPTQLLAPREATEGQRGTPNS